MRKWGEQSCFVPIGAKRRDNEPDRHCRETREVVQINHQRPALEAGSHRNFGKRLNLTNAGAGSQTVISCSRMANRAHWTLSKLLPQPETTIGCEFVKQCRVVPAIFSANPADSGAMPARITQGLSANTRQEDVRDGTFRNAIAQIIGERRDFADPKGAGAPESAR